MSPREDPRRLLSVIHGPEFGGAHNQLMRLAEPLQERGFETVAVLPMEADAAAARLGAAGVRTHQVPLSRLRATPSPATQVRFLGAVRGDVQRLRALITAEDAQLVQVHGPTNPQGALAALPTEAAVVWQILDTRAPMPLRRLSMPLVRRWADAVTCWGEALVRSHPGAERLGDRLTVIYPPVDTDALRPDPERQAQARSRMGIPAGAPSIGTVAVRNPQKGIEWLIRAAARVRQSAPEAHFRVIGAPSPAHAEYERGLREEVAELGLKPVFDFVDPGSEAQDLMHGLDVFALTSVPRSEGIPTVIGEAMALGKPVVATDVGAVRELVADRESGLVVVPEDPEAIATALTAFVRDPSRARESGRAGRRIAEERLGLAGLAALHAGAYEAALRHKRSRTS